MTSLVPRHLSEKLRGVWQHAHQELMSGEAAKERVTPVPSKSGLLTYIRFGEAQCASCGLSPT